tara:strand:- start:787 stop:1050 length:264 start_codon:yes stop_codon:yes gene_type:complete
MGNKEKYINYIVDDLIKKTDIDYTAETFKYPFYPISFKDQKFRSIYLNTNGGFFRVYIEERYGTNKEEMGMIWDQYKERMLILINNG